MIATSVTPSPVNELADHVWDRILELDPVWATALGDERWSDRLDDPGPAGREREQALIAQLVRDAEPLDRPDLPTEERVTLDMLRVVGHVRQQHHEHHLWQLAAVDQIAGPQTLPTELARYQRIDTPERFERLLARLEHYPAHIDQHIENLREGRRAGRTAARPAVERTIAQVRRGLETAADGSPLLAAHPELPSGQRDRLSGAVERTIRPAWARFLEALEAYLPSARTGDGICWLPNGEHVYRAAILASTTLDEDPRAIHEYGLERLEAVDRERRSIARELGYRDLPALREALATDPSNVARDPGELVRLARDAIERASAVAPQWFRRLPRARCEVRPVEPHQEQEAPPAFYGPPAADGSRPGIFFINTYDPASRPLHRLAATAFHEAVPGHHFQIALETELEGLPAFRRLGSRLAGAAYPEGWGLYSERLADEMGLYVDARERFGMLEAQAWRAVRLIVDTGIHAFGWDRQQSIELLRTGAGLSQLEAETETDRYITWPGQALAYMTGQREIEALRRSLEARDGARFDLRAFHDAVLGHGSLPLATLRRELPGWVAPTPA